MSNTVLLSSLREQIRELEGGPRLCSSRAPSGVSALDTLTGGLARPGLVELRGERGSGAVRLALALVAQETRQRRRVAWVDACRTLHPPAAHAIGVDLDRLLIVRPPAAATTTAHATTWAIEQLLRSGCFGLVVITEPPLEHRFAGQRWRQAAEQGGCTGLFVTRTAHAARAIQSDFRLGIEGRRLSVERDRQRASGGLALLPPWPEHVDPWPP